jgi:hypothetical protein
MAETASPSPVLVDGDIGKPETAANAVGSAGLCQSCDLTSTLFDRRNPCSPSLEYPDDKLTFD